MEQLHYWLKQAVSDALILHGSVMLTSNLVFSDWERIFKDQMTTAAGIDRLVHHCVILEMNLPSYRLEAAKKRLPKTVTS